MSRMIDLNVTALTRLTYAAVPGFVCARPWRDHQHFVDRHRALNGVYGGSKAFVLAFSQSLHHELAAKGLRVQAYCRGRPPRTSGKPVACRSNIPTRRSLCRPKRWSMRRWWLRSWRAGDDSTAARDRAMECAKARARRWRASYRPTPRARYATGR
jgi:NAD(P)-dependent dehydrogenase (short-subunit alcohol dehydrogenase family)